MTKQLEDAIRRLTPEQVEKLTELAEAMPSLIERPMVNAPAPAQLEWAGCLKDGPWKSGLEAQEAANQMRIELALRGMPK